MAMDERQRLIALAHLKLGKSPREAAELVGITYAAAVTLRKQLAEAEEQQSIKQLFNLPEAAFDTLIESVKENTIAALEGELVTGKEIETAFNELSAGVKGLQALEVDMQKAATALARNITLMAVTASSSDTILNLAEALHKLQTAFFAKGTNIQINNNGPAKFEAFLSE